MASDDNNTLNIDLGLNEEIAQTHPHNMGNVSTISPPPTLRREPVKVSKVAELFEKDKADFMREQSSLLELCSSISSDVEHLGLEEVSARTIEYVDNNNKSVLLINKHLFALGKPLVPVIAPGLAPHYLTTITLAEAKQGSILLYSLDEENASLGILMAKSTTGDKTLYKTLTTQSNKIVVIYLSEDQIKIPMR